MKTRDLKVLGFRPYIDGEGAVAYVLAALAVSDGAAKDLTKPQVAAAMRTAAEKMRQGADKIDPPTASGGEKA